MGLFKKFGKGPVITGIVTVSLFAATLTSGIVFLATDGDNGGYNGYTETIEMGSRYYVESGYNDYTYYCDSSSYYKLVFDDIYEIESISIYNQYGDYYSVNRYTSEGCYYFSLDSGYQYSISIYGYSSFSFYLTYY